MAYFTQLVLLQGTTLLELSAILARRDPEWNGHFHESGGVNGMCFPWALPPCTMPEDLEDYCFCRACEGCLECEGVISVLSTR